jgi:hypothetical protein
MILDYVLDHLATEWVSTEQDKVAFFTTRFGVPLWELPHRVYLGRRHGRNLPTTTRYFVHKLPIGVRPDTSTVTFVVLVTDTGGQLLSQFLRDHQPLLCLLPCWRIVAVLPRHVAGLPACEEVFRRFSAAPAYRRSADERDDLRFAFRIWDRVDRNENLRDVTVADLNRVRQIRDRVGASEFERLLLRWKASGDAALEDLPASGFQAAIAGGRGRLETYRLPIRHDRFGTRAGVS